MWSDYRGWLRGPRAKYAAALVTHRVTGRGPILMASYIKTATRSGDAVDAAAAAGVVNDGQNYKEAIRIVECSGRIDCKGK